MQVKIDGMHILVGMPLYGAPTTKTTISLLKTQAFCIHNNIRFDLSAPTGFVTVGRDMVLDEFLKSDAHKLFWIDSDMVWGIQEFARMVALSTQHDVVCAAYPLKEDGPVRRYPILADETAQANKFGLLEIHGAGLGFSVWSKEVCQALADSKPTINDGFANADRKSVFCVAPRHGRMRTEDMNAFEDIRALGFKVWLDPSIELGHVGQKEWRGSIAEALTKCN